MPEEEKLYQIAAEIVIWVYADSELEAVEKARQATTNWDDWNYKETVEVLEEEK